MSDASTSGPQFYDAGELLPDELPLDPFPTFEAWLNAAKAAKDQPNPNCFTLSTLGEDGAPSSRVVLCRGVDVEGGKIVFYTNYEGRKGRELANDPRCCVNFHWDHVERQVRMEGEVVRASAEESDAYFASRRWESRVGAWASDQSRPLSSRQELLDKVAQQMIDLGIDLGAVLEGENPEIPRPPHWGGFWVVPHTVELWCGDTGRIHDRAVWTRELTRDGETITGGAWTATRLQP
jgi:pyridoxamine 5'-phosphate oxidase